MATNIIDPNDAIASASQINLGLNATPDYSDMFIFAELTAIRRASSIITTNGAGKRSLDIGNEAVKINLMGFDKETGQYTTRWTENIGGAVTPFEGFGMVSLKMDINSSYVPIVEIEFVDIRGLSLVSLGSKSPYSVLYSFPPPIFTLTLKGYYGKAASYDLHLKTQSTRFDATTGNYQINANFIMQRYGLLTDIPFKYIDIVPLIDDGVKPSGTDTATLDLNPLSPPKNTRELLTKAKKLYDELKNVDTKSSEGKNLNEYRNNIANISLAIDNINNSKNNVASILENGIGLYIYNTIGNNKPDEPVDDVVVLKEIKKVNEYDGVIKTESTNIDASKSSNLKKKLYILFKYSAYINGVESNFDPQKLQSAKDGLDDLKLKLIADGSKINSYITDSTITRIDENKIQVVKENKYIGLDITQYYLYIYQELTKNKQNFTESSSKLKNKINGLATKELGENPSIRNIFKIICNDVEVFQKKIVDVCKKAEVSHEKYIDQIITNNKTLPKPKSISAFPLILKNGEYNSQVRAYPGEDGLGFNVDFPEVDFVEDFMRAFLNVIKNENILNLKESIDGDGNNKWIPANPFDSAINGETSESPYKNKYKLIGGKDDQESLLYEILNRFYLISQYSYSYLFYVVDAAILKDFLDFFGVSIDNKNNNLIEYTAKAEATNLINSVVDGNLLSSLETQISNWKNNISDFYDYLEQNSTIYSTFENQVDDGSTYIIINGKKLFKNKNNSGFFGFDYTDEVPVLRNKSKSITSDESASDINFVDTFIDNFTTSTIIFDNHGFDDLTSTNIPYFKDKLFYEDKKNYGSDFITEKVDNLLSAISTKLTFDAINANAILNDPEINDNVKAYYILRELACSASFYDINGDRNVNKKFIIPGVVEVPNFAFYYMGCLVNLYRNTNESNESSKAKLKTYVNVYSGKNKTLDDDNGAYTFFLSIQDSEKLENAFKTYLTEGNENGFLYSKNRILSLISEVNGTNITSTDFSKFEKYVELLLTPNYENMLIKLTLVNYVLNYNENTFTPFDTNTTDIVIATRNFEPIKDINRNSRHKPINDNYFGLFFNECLTLIKKKKESISNLEKNFNKGIEDNDIKNQTYYSFKAITDKWVIGLDKSEYYGDGNKLINDFQFIDRFGNDIGDKVMIDIRPLIELSQDYDVSVFTVLNRLLSLNGFEFFPLQNFINFNDNEWQDSFKTFGSTRNLIKSQQPAFVCMYIGGTSSQLDDPLSMYPDDGFKNKTELSGSPDAKLGNVKGFVVSFAKQNQSMFTSIDLNTNEHKETNESLSILSELAQDQSNATPVPKGQNLFATYEQRSYSCNVQGFGNVMIQPTQYFILENVPMFNGAYLILNVSHVISLNSMKTNFSGVRIRKYANPLVTDFATSSGIVSGDSDVDNVNSTGNGNSSESQIYFDPKIIEDMNNKLISPTQ